jgi:voltage-gated sodium channel
MIVKTCRRIAENPRFQKFILAVIVLNALFMGIETSHALMASHGALLHLLDRIIQAIFIVEVSIRVTAFWPSLGKFFKDGWNTFDFSVVVLSLLPVAGPFAAVARLARVLRVTRIVTHSEELKLIIGTMLKSIPSMGHVSMLLGILLYVYGVIGWHLFHETDPARWGTLSSGFWALFQILTLEGWVEMHEAVVKDHPFAWIFFGTYVVIAVFVVVNLFIAVVLNNLQSVQAELDQMAKGKGRKKKK